MVTVIKNTVLRIWKLLRVGLKSSHHQKNKPCDYVWRLALTSFSVVVILQYIQMSNQLCFALEANEMFYVNYIYIFNWELLRKRNKSKIIAVIVKLLAKMREDMHDFFEVKNIYTLLLKCDWSVLRKLTPSSRPKLKNQLFQKNGY